MEPRTPVNYQDTPHRTFLCVSISMHAVQTQPGLPAVHPAHDLATANADAVCSTRSVRRLRSSLLSAAYACAVATF